jgi:hypothetical protein
MLLYIEYETPCEKVLTLSVLSVTDNVSSKVFSSFRLSSLQNIQILTLNAKFQHPEFLTLILLFLKVVMTKVVVINIKNTSLAIDEYAPRQIRGY